MGVPQPMTGQFISEPITPLPGAPDTRAMVRGEPGLPPGFVWRDQEYRVVERLDAGKTLSPDRGELYVRRHTWRLRMDDDSVWEVYFLRQPAKGAARGRTGARWYLKTVSGSR
jgi:hypothetical protein